MPSPFTLRRAAQAVGNGGIIAYPTEAVYGLGCNPEDPDAVYRLLGIKQRSPDKGLIVIAADISQLEHYFAPLTKQARTKLMSSWPGPQTWLVPAADTTPAWLTGSHQTIAVRVSAHPVASALCRACGHGLVSTSANLTGEPAMTDMRAVHRRLGSKLDYIVNGRCGDLPRPTPIQDLASRKILRS